MSTSNDNRLPESDDSNGGLIVVLFLLLGIPVVGILLKLISDWMGQ